MTIPQITVLNKKFIGNNQFSGLSVEDRFWQKVDKRSDDECWNWIASINKKGYGNFSETKGKFIFAHRFVWKLVNGIDVPKGFLILHHCDNPACVNPKHLFLGTNEDNMKDMARKGRSTRGEKSWTSKLTEDNIRYIRSVPNSWGISTKLAKEFNVDKGTIAQIRRRITWTYLD